MRLWFKSGVVWALLLLCCALPLHSQQITETDKAFRKADKNDDGKLSFIEFRDFLRAQNDLNVKSPRQLFTDIDRDQDRLLSAAEFRAWLEGTGDESTKSDSEAFPIPDPGPGYVLFSGLDQPIDDAKAYAAIYYRSMEMKESHANLSAIKMAEIPKHTAVPFSQAHVQSSMELACRATVVIAGGKSDDDFFTGGGVIISPGGLCLTNYHIAKAFNDGLTVVLADGRATRPLEIVAANREMDVALIRLEGEDFTWVPIARSAPPMADEIKMIHHSENRFYTFDQGYVKRYPRIGGEAWLEISAPFAPGGSGCGVFNSNWELVGLVCVITVGDGPAIALDSMAEDLVEEENSDDDVAEEEDDFGFDITAIVVRLAVPWSALKDLFSNE